MGRLIDYTGQTINGIKFIRREGSTKQGRPMWRVLCYCGKEFVVNPQNLKKKNPQRSCGCYKLQKTTKHGGSGTRLYNCWHDMKRRCNNENATNYYNYGGRGIVVCDEWNRSDSFPIFREWALDNGYSDELTLDRRDNDGNYEPSNCRWVDYSIQNKNKRVRKENKSGLQGITWWEEKGKWTPLFPSVPNGRQGYKGSYHKLEVAIKVRQELEIEYWGYTVITEKMAKEAILKNERTKGE